MFGRNKEEDADVKEVKHSVKKHSSDFDDLLDDEDESISVNEQIDKSEENSTTISEVQNKPNRNFSHQRRRPSEGKEEIKKVETSDKNNGKKSMVKQKIQPKKVQQNKSSQVNKSQQNKSIQEKKIQPKAVEAQQVSESVTVNKVEQSKPKPVIVDCANYTDKYFGKDICRSFMIEAMAVEEVKETGSADFNYELMPDLQVALIDTMINNLVGSRDNSGGVTFI